MGQWKDENNAYLNAKNNANIRVTIMLSKRDQVKDTGLNDQRKFPWDTSAGTEDLYFRGYGPGLKTTTTLTLLIPSKEKFDSS